MNGDETSARTGESAVVCDHPDLDHDVAWSYCWTCPGCGVCKFIGHGPLCLDCFSTRPGQPTPTRGAADE